MAGLPLRAGPGGRRSRYNQEASPSFISSNGGPTGVAGGLQMQACLGAQLLLQPTSFGMSSMAL